MELFDPAELKKLYIPDANSHKGENGKLLIIGGSHLFHAASLWALSIASKIVDMVFYCSVSENNQIVEEAKKEFRDGIVVLRNDVEHYVKEADAILIGPGMMRTEKNLKSRSLNLEEINILPDEGEQTYYLTKYLLSKYPEKKWIIDAGALQMLETEWLRPLSGRVILTPNPAEFRRVFQKEATEENISAISKEYTSVVLLKGKEDICCSSEECRKIVGGNAGMTKGGTGDVLAGLIAALATKNELFLSACAGSYLNKKAGERLYEKVGLYFNSSDLVEEIPKVTKSVLD